MPYVDYHDGMSGIVFEDWLENTLTANIPKEKKVVVVMENAEYRCRLIEKAPTMNMKKNEIIAFMSKHHLELPNPVPTKSVLLENILKKILENSISLILWLKKLAILFCGCLRIVPY